MRDRTLVLTATVGTVVRFGLGGAWVRVRLEHKSGSKLVKLVIHAPLGVEIERDRRAEDEGTGPEHPEPHFVLGGAGLGRRVDRRRGRPHT